MIERVLVDTGPIVALISEHDEHHEGCREALATLAPPIFTCWPVLTEAAWILRKRPSAVEKLFEAFDAGLFSLLSLDAGDLAAIAAVLKSYHSAGLQLAAAALVHLAARENILTVFTTDRRDFSIIRLPNNRPLKLIPDIQ